MVLMSRGAFASGDGKAVGTSLLRRNSIVAATSELGSIEGSIKSYTKKQPLRDGRLCVFWIGPHPTCWATEPPAVGCWPDIETRQIESEHR